MSHTGSRSLAELDSIAAGMTARRSGYRDRAPRRQGGSGPSRDSRPSRERRLPAGPARRGSRPRRRPSRRAARTSYESTRGASGSRGPDGDPSATERSPAWSPPGSTTTLRIGPRGITAITRMVKPIPAVRSDVSSGPFARARPDRPRTEPMTARSRPTAAESRIKRTMASRIVNRDDAKKTEVGHRIGPDIRVGIDYEMEIHAADQEGRLHVIRRYTEPVEHAVREQVRVVRREEVEVVRGELAWDRDHPGHEQRKSQVRPHRRGDHRQGDDRRRHPTRRSGRTSAEPRRIARYSNGTKMTDSSISFNPEIDVDQELTRDPRAGTRPPSASCEAESR